MKKFFLTLPMTLLLVGCISKVETDMVPLEIHKNNLLSAYGEHISSEGVFLWALKNKHLHSPETAYSFIDGYTTMAIGKSQSLIESSVQEQLAKFYSKETMEILNLVLIKINSLNENLKAYFGTSQQITKDELKILNKKIEELYLSISNIGPGGSQSLVLYHMLTDPYGITNKYSETEINDHLDEINKQLTEILNIIESD